MTPVAWLSWAWTYELPRGAVALLELMYLAPLPRLQALSTAAYTATLMVAGPLAWLHIPRPWDRVLMLCLVSLMAGRALALTVRKHRNGLELIAVAWEGAAALWALLFLPPAPRRVFSFLALAMVALPTLPMVTSWSWRPPWSLRGRLALPGGPDSAGAEELLQRAVHFRLSGDHRAAAYCDYVASFALRRTGADREPVIAALRRAADDARAARDQTLLRKILILRAAVLCQEKRSDEARLAIAELQALERRMVLFLGRDKPQAETLARLCPP